MEQPPGGWPGERRRRLLRVNARVPQRFIGVDVANTADPGLVQQDLLDSSGSSTPYGGCLPRFPRRVQCVAPDMRDARGYRRQLGPVPAGQTIHSGQHSFRVEVPKGALIQKVQGELLTRCLEAQSHAAMRVRFRRVVPRLAVHAELPGHAQVCRQSKPGMGMVFPQWHPQELPSPHGSIQDGSAHMGFKLALSAKEQAHCGCAKHCNILNKGTTHKRLEALPYGFYLGQLRHRAPCSGLSRRRLTERGDHCKGAFCGLLLGEFLGSAGAFRTHHTVHHHAGSERARVVWAFAGDVIDG